MVQINPASFEITLPLPVPTPRTDRPKLGPGAVKNAVTLVPALIVTWQVRVPLHAPNQPVKVLPLVGVAVRVTVVPGV
jgi:hypothetical protein